MDSSPGFASAARDSTPCSDSLSLRLGHSLTSPRAATRWLILQKARRHTYKGAPTACRQAVSGTVSLPSRGAFHLSLTVLVRYRSQESIQGWRVVPPGSDRVSRARPYSGAAFAPGIGFAYGALTRCGRPSHAVPLPVSGRAGRRQAPPTRSYNPGGAKAAARVRSPVCPRPPFARRYSGDLEVDFFSSGYLDVSVPPVVLPGTMYSSRG